jgi:hypothetical protein
VANETIYVGSADDYIYALTEDSENSTSSNG